MAGLGWDICLLLHTDRHKIKTSIENVFCSFIRVFAAQLRAAEMRIEMTATMWLKCVERSTETEIRHLFLFMVAERD